MYFLINARHLGALLETRLASPVVGSITWNTTANTYIHIHYMHHTYIQTYIHINSRGRLVVSDDDMAFGTKK